MTWIRLDDGFAGHPKVVAAGVSGLALQVRAFCFSGRYNTDGLIPSSQVPSLVAGLLDQPDVQPNSPAGWADHMVRCGLWEKTDGGYRIHDFLDFNISKEDVTDHKSGLTARQIKAGRARAASANRTPDGRFIQPMAGRLDQPMAGQASPAGSIQPNQPSQPPSSSSSLELPPISPKGDFLPSTPPPIAKDPLNGHGSGNGHRPRRQATAAFKQDAVELLAWLNQQAGSDFRPLEMDGRPSKSLELIMARLRSGIPMFQLRLMISRQVKAWQGDPEMAQYLRPATLFNRTKCEQYVGQLKTAAAGAPDPYAKFPR